MFEEYPRPQMERDNWFNLCGEWDYAITKSGKIPETWEGVIRVPFSPEAPASGVSRLVKPDEFLWYRRNVEFPADGGRVLLHFGAVDQTAVVWCNGREVAAHTGGYTPFTADLTDALGDGGRGEILVAVRDGTGKTELGRGKQKMARGGLWYTPQSGIWQPVWAERVPQEYIRSLRVTPRYDEGEVEIDAIPGGTVQFGGQTYECPARIPLCGFVPWTPGNPYLYEFTVTLGEDRVKSYFAMRKFSVKNARLCLNNRVFFMNGVLDQGYNPEGLMTYPSDEAMIRDIRTAKDMGFNTLRKHVKTEPLRWYYHCDRLGMLVWQDIPNGGAQNYNDLVVAAPNITGVTSLKDDKYILFGRRSPAGRKQYYNELTELVGNLYNCPCIAMWVLFNEGWGQFDAAKARELVLSMDGTRLVDHASGWYDQGVGDIKSVHVYFQKYRHIPDKLGRAVILSEFGGYNLRVWGHTWNEKDFGYNSCADAADLETKLHRLYWDEIYPAKKAGLAAVIFTQLTDVEEELNGLVTYDRQVVKLPLERIRRITNILNTLE
jgi:beta-galactosidase/beta-glucuronidase